MRFIVIGPDSEPKMGTAHPSCVYPTETLQTMEKANYRFTVDGKPVKASKVHELLKGVPEPPPTKEPKILGTETGRIDCSGPNVAAVPKSIESAPVVQVAADVPPYNVKWSLCKRSKSYDDTKASAKQFDDRSASIAFLQKKKETSGLSYWAGGVVEDSSGKIILTLSL